MKIGRWRVFRPQKSNLLYDPTAYETDSVYVAARKLVDQTLQQVKGKGIEGAITRTTKAAKILRAKQRGDSVSLLALLIVQTPSAVRAQRSIAKKFGGYLNRQAKVFELIDFNDTFVELVLSLPEKDIPDFNDRLKIELERFCRKMHTQPFSDKELEAIIHGLSREIAVYRGAKAEGYVAKMTSRVQDAMGVDMIVTDPESKKSIGIDIKTRSAFHWRLVNLARQETITDHTLEQCEQAGFCRIHNSRDKRSSTVLFRIDTTDDHLGEVKDYKFTNTAPLGAKLRRALQEQGQYITTAI
ncbi:MAG TPA: hypothetical protein PKD19_01235 [Candidatus Saccharibacteria bacterium]|nr:hypothetical protein [Candidatus Saccharibacteria bacterium]HMR37979.1 hypothetical protein [Candidatus Saccharibacteria bacterium]